MKLDRWIERVYSERDIGRGIATSAAGASGLVTYLLCKDVVIAVFVTVILFPLGRIMGVRIAFALGPIEKPSPPPERVVRHHRRIWIRREICG
jgi:hypothetical protein